MASNDDGQLHLGQSSHKEEQLVSGEMDALAIEPGDVEQFQICQYPLQEAQKLSREISSLQIESSNHDQQIEQEAVFQNIGALRIESSHHEQQLRGEETVSAGISTVETEYSDNEPIQIFNHSLEEKKIVSEEISILKVESSDEEQLQMCHYQDKEKQAVSEEISTLNIERSGEEQLQMCHYQGKEKQTVDEELSTLKIELSDEEQLQICHYQGEKKQAIPGEISMLKIESSGEEQLQMCHQAKEKQAVSEEISTSKIELNDGKQLQMYQYSRKMWETVSRKVNTLNSKSTDNEQQQMCHYQHKEKQTVFGESSTRKIELNDGKQLQMYQYPRKMWESVSRKVNTLNSKSTDNEQLQLCQYAIKEEHAVTKEINILLMGETGVGKSTFINAFANYLTHQNLMDAVEDEITCLIPSKFTVTDENYDERTIEIGHCENEAQEVGVSATQDPRSYIFPFDDIRIRLIDTPGIGDTRGADQDNINFENLLSYLGEFKELHAICILLKPNNARITVMFEYCIKQLLSRLEKSASNNIVFLFTNSRGTFYRPGDTLPPLRKILTGTENRPPYVKIPLDKQNIYCVDNEAFRFLIALKHGIQFTEREQRDFEASWKISSEECWRFLRYVEHLKPHAVQNTISVNEARRLILQLSQPLAEMANLIQINILQLQRQKELLNLCSDDVEKLKGNLYIPVTNLRIEALDKPRTVCTDLNCCEVFQVNGSNTYHYKQVCHNPCYLQNIPKEIVGSPQLINCSAMSGNQNCGECGCSYLKHMHIYYQSFPYEDNIVDENVNSQITNKKNARRAAKKVIVGIEQRRKEYEQEQEVITKNTAKFAHFLQNNAITPYNDAYQSYLEYLIDREKSLGDQSSKKNIENLQKMLQQYIEEKRTLDRAFDLAQQDNMSNIPFITAESVMEAIDDLYSLPHCGSKIKEIFDKQHQAKRNENFIEHEVVINRHNIKFVQRVTEIGMSFVKQVSKIWSWKGSSKF